MTGKDSIVIFPVTRFRGTKYGDCIGFACEVTGSIRSDQSVADDDDGELGFQMDLKF